MNRTLFWASYASDEEIHDYVSEVLSTMHPKTHFHRRLEVLVNSELHKLMAEISVGISDVNQYWRSVGMIAGLQGALRLCDDLEQEDDN